MKAAFLAVRSDHASVYHRSIQFMPGLARMGLESTLIALPQRWLPRLGLFKRLASFDVVLVHRKLFNSLNLVPLRHFSRKLVFDLDDALFIHDSKSARAASMTRNARFKGMAKQADLVICGNAWIEERAAKVASKTAIMPTAVDLDHYVPKAYKEARSGFTALWIGSRSTLFYLEKLLPALEPLKDRIPGFKLRVVSDAFPDPCPVPLEKISWSRRTEAKAIAACDVGLMPLADDAWSEGKCGLKLLQYGAAALPSVCTPTAHNARIVRHGLTGFHGKSPESWRDALLRLADDPGLRRCMGEEARRIVEEEFSVQALLPRYFELLEKTARSLRAEYSI